ncbi:DUF2997 domain-containing protein [Oceanobacter sp. 5_MG-2023]|uniref:DUF2997 domain-containing protein n=1 Tax=Oceanobacter sp. 5_MG-2023 TaxID=3062645 RepID=UPI0026E463CC|nr:DUF2997 domain-containing protein [Oceanobacter sp. 5_MG-2023]MDO6683766.1 DUF2997 domain-containing protein [Oceanobacter sp. 5_MG-2023]
MPEQKIVITIDDDGVIIAKTAGFKGESCLEALDDLLNLNGVVGEVKKTDEYHQLQAVKKTHIQTIKGRS